ncbi:MAG TPA: hypothetical protein VEC01_15580 [Noviherbaspirillum sp.]|uniref:hypothetical protein n=1 Tax=Noviherbaspirillum sp. TaxID=1926288 RepID=UPI002D75AE61|nr:hypothetical protein [Noviherbaspirillum sp.]HYD96749.1 hypothetical protein [Noviherbaspirillum sp.]
MKPLTYLIAALLSPVLTTVALADSNITLKTGYDFSSGTYGSTTRTDISAVPFIGSYETGNWTLKATLPYIRITGADNVVAGVGAVRQTGVAARTASGWGDLTAAATYSFALDPKAQFGVDVSGKIKFGIADSARGLGTGEHDYWLLVDPYRRIGNTTWFGGLGYGVLGSSPGLKLKNVVSANVGLSQKIDDRASAGVIFDYRTRSTDIGYAQRELTAFYSRKFDADYKMQAYATKGFSDGSPDWGAGLNLGRQF